MDQLVSMLMAPALTCVKSGVNGKAAVMAFKKALIKCAVKEIEGDGELAHYQRVALRTGLDRREVSKLTQEGTAYAGPQLNYACVVLHHWQADPAYSTTSGRMDLPVLGPNPSFDTLCKQYATNIPPHEVLTWLESSKCVEVRAGNVIFLKREFISDDELLRVGVAKRALTIFGSTIKHNLQEKDPEKRFFQKTNTSRVIPEHRLEDFRAVLKLALGEKLEELRLETIDPYEKQHGIKGDPGGCARVAGVALSYVES